MKKITAIILLLAMALSLFACGAKPALVEMDPIKVTGIYFTASPEATADKDTFAKYYNNAEVISKAKEEDVKGNDVITVTLAGDGVFTLYALDDNRFAVTGSAIEKDYIIKSAELSELYDNAINPTPEFVKVNAEDIASATYVAYPEIEADAAAIVAAYNDAALVKKANDETAGDTIILLYENGKDTLTISSVGEDQFIVSGTVVAMDYIVESADLAALYSEATK